MLGKMEGRRRGRQRMRWVGGIADSMDMRLSKFQESVMDGESLACCGPRGCTESGLSELTIKGKWDIQEKNLVFFCVWVKEERNRPKLTSSWKRSKLHLNIPREFWTTCLVAMEITHLGPNSPPGLTDTRFHSKISLHQDCNSPLLVNHLYVILTASIGVGFDVEAADPSDYESWHLPLTL